MNKDIIWLVRNDTGREVAIVSAPERERAKNRANALIPGDKDRFTVTPLTDVGDRVTCNLSIKTTIGVLTDF